MSENEQEKIPEVENLTGVEFHRAAHVNMFRCVSWETGKPCSSSPGDYFMCDMDELLHMDVERLMESGVVMPDGEYIVCRGWYTVGEPVTRRYLTELRAKGGRFVGDIYTA